MKRIVIGIALIFLVFGMAYSVKHIKEESEVPLVDSIFEPLSFDITGSNSELVMPPSSIYLSGTNSVSFSNNKYTFTYSESGNVKTSYVIDVSNNDVSQGALVIKENVSNSFPVYYAGPTYRKLDNSILSVKSFADQVNVTFTHSLNSDEVVLNYNETFGSVNLGKEYIIKISGKSLIINVSGSNSINSSKSNYESFVMGYVNNGTNYQDVEIPYMEYSPITYFENNGAGYFTSTYFDYALSHSNKAVSEVQLSSGNNYTNSYTSKYTSGVNNRFPKLGEVIYVTVSDDIQDLLIQINSTPSDYRADLNDRVTFDWWRDTSSFTFLSGSNNFQKLNTLKNNLYNYGMKNLILDIHDWQKYGFDCGLPTHYPAKSSLGSSSDVVNLVSDSKSKGYLINLHENYIDMYNNSDYFNVSDLALAASGSYSTAWYNSVCTGAEQSSKLRVDRSAYYSDLESTQIKQNYGTNSGYLDVSTSNLLWNMIDYSENSLSFTNKEVYQNILSLNDKMHEIYQGPLFGEGRKIAYGSDRIQSGNLGVDGTEGEIVGGNIAFIIPDYELKYVKPVMVNQGMGYHSRWANGAEYGNYPTNLTPTNFDFDGYRMHQIAYGHTGFISDTSFPYMGIEEFTKYAVKEYYYFKEFQEEYLSSEINSIEYYTGSDFVDLSEAISLGVDFNHSRIKMTYNNGLVVFTNGATSTWNVSLNDHNYYLPEDGWVAENTNDNFIVYSALVDSNGLPDSNGHRVDYIGTNNYILADGRGNNTYFGQEYHGSNVTFDKLIVIKPNSWFIYESDGYLLNTVCVSGDGCNDSSGQTECSGTCDYSTPIEIYSTETQSSSSSSSSSSGGGSSGGGGGGGVFTIPSNSSNLNSSIEMNYGSTENGTIFEPKNEMPAETKKSKTSVLGIVLLVIFTLGIIVTSVIFYLRRRAENNLESLVYSNN